MTMYFFIIDIMIWHRCPWNEGPNSGLTSWKSPAIVNWRVWPHDKHGMKVI